MRTLSTLAVTICFSLSLPSLLVAQTPDPAQATLAAAQATVAAAQSLVNQGANATAAQGAAVQTSAQALANAAQAMGGSPNALAVQASAQSTLLVSQLTAANAAPAPANASATLAAAKTTVAILQLAAATSQPAGAPIQPAVQSPIDYMDLVKGLAGLARTKTGATSFAARLQAIDSIGNIGTKSENAAQELGAILKAILQADFESILDSKERPLFALHLVQALGKIGPTAKNQLTNIANAITIDVDLIPAVQQAMASIQSQPAPPIGR